MGIIKLFVPILVSFQFGLLFVNGLPTNLRNVTSTHTTLNSGQNTNGKLAVVLTKLSYFIRISGTPDK